VGLDTVELVMAIEEGFGFEIPNEQAAKMFTVGHMHAYLVAELSRRGQREDEAHIYARMRDVICRQTGVEAREIVPSASFVDDLRLH
jgi:acyl carrier protein